MRERKALKNCFDFVDYSSPVKLTVGQTHEEHYNVMTVGVTVRLMVIQTSECRHKLGDMWGHEVGTCYWNMLQEQFYRNFQCRMLCTALAHCPRHNTFCCLNPLLDTSLHIVPATASCIPQYAYIQRGLTPLTSPQHVP